MYRVSESNGVSLPRSIVTFETFDSAYDYINNQKPVFLELDADNEGCADAYMKDGRILMIEPIDRRA